MEGRADARAQADGGQPVPHLPATRPQAPPRAETRGKTHRAARAADGSLELDDLYLYPAFQGRGIGTEVLEKSIAEADAPIFLYVFRANTRAIRLYERFGFRVTEEVSPTRCIMRRA